MLRIYDAVPRLLLLLLRADAGSPAPGVGGGGGVRLCALWRRGYSCFRIQQHYLQWSERTQYLVAVLVPRSGAWARGYRSWRPGLDYSWGEHVVAKAARECLSNK